jgi:hypothetical protein
MGIPGFFSCLKACNSRDPIVKSLLASSSVESPDSFLETIKENVIAQFVEFVDRKAKGIVGQTGETGTFPTQCHHNGEVLSI